MTASLATTSWGTPDAFVHLSEFDNNGLSIVHCSVVPTMSFGCDDSSTSSAVRPQLQFWALLMPLGIRVTFVHLSEFDKNVLSILP